MIVPQFCFRSLFETDFDGKYHMVNTEEEADIIWSASHLKDYSSFRKSQLISQFPNEWLLTTKVFVIDFFYFCNIRLDWIDGNS